MLRPQYVKVFISIPAYRMSLSATTTVYAKLRFYFGGTAPHTQGRLSARRIR